jgi:outer membrane receptor for ferrienterochelin and colicin
MFRQKIGANGKLKIFYSGELSKLDLEQPSILDVTENVRVDLSNQFHYLNANYKGILKKHWMVDAGISNTWSKDISDMDYYSGQNMQRNLHFKFTTIFDKGKSASLKIGTDVYHYNYRLSTGTSLENQSHTDEINDMVPALYLESNIYFSHKFIGVVGGRWEYASLSGKSILSPRVSLAYKTGEFSQISLASGLYHQRPDAQYLIYNKQLQDERAMHYILNFQYSRDQRTFRAEAYYKDYDQLVRFHRVNVIEFEHAGNDGYGHAGGLDIFWRDSRTVRNVDYWLSYSFLNTNRLYRDYPVESVPYFASRHNFSFVYKHFIEEIQTQIGLTYSFASGRPYNDPNEDKFNSNQTPAYHDLSMNFSYLVKTNFIIHFSVTNVLGRDNTFGYQYSLVPDENGIYSGIPIGQPAKRFIFLGVFITLTKDNTSNQLRNL